MAKKLSHYNPSTTLVSGLTPAGDLDTPLMEAHDIVVEYKEVEIDGEKKIEEVRLDDKLNNFKMSATNVVTGKDEENKEITLDETLTAIEKKIDNQNLSADDIMVGEKTLTEALAELNELGTTIDGETIVRNEKGELTAKPQACVESGLWEYTRYTHDCTTESKLVDEVYRYNIVFNLPEHEYRIFDDFSYVVDSNHGEILDWNLSAENGCVSGWITNKLANVSHTIHMVYRYRNGEFKKVIPCVTNKNEGLMSVEDRRVLHPFLEYQDKLVRGIFKGVNPPVKKKTVTIVAAESVEMKTFQGRDDRFTMHTITGNLVGSGDGGAIRYQDTFKITLPVDNPLFEVLQIEAINVTSTGDGLHYAKSLSGNILTISISSNTPNATHTYEITYSVCVAPNESSPYTKETITLYGVNEYGHILEVDVSGGTFESYSWNESSPGVVEVRINDTNTEEFYTVSITYETDMASGFANVVLDDLVVEGKDVAEGFHQTDTILGVIVDGEEIKDFEWEFIGINKDKRIRVRVPNLHSNIRYTCTIQYGIPAPYETHVRVPYDFHDLTAVIYREDTVQMIGAKSFEFKRTSAYGTVDIIAFSDVKGQIYEYSFMVGHANKIKSIEERFAETEKYNYIIQKHLTGYPGSEQLVTDRLPTLWFSVIVNFSLTINSPYLTEFNALKKRVEDGENLSDDEKKQMALYEKYINNYNQKPDYYTISFRGVSPTFSGGISSVGAIVDAIQSIHSTYVPLNVGCKKTTYSRTKDSNSSDFGAAIFESSSPIYENSYHAAAIVATHQDSFELYIMDVPSSDRMEWKGGFSEADKGKRITNIIVDRRCITGPDT